MFKSAALGLGFITRRVSRKSNTASRISTRPKRKESRGSTDTFTRFESVCEKYFTENYYR